MFQWQPYAILPALGMVVSIFVARTSWRRREATPAAGALLLLMIGAGEWTAVNAIGFSLSNVHAQAALSLAEYPGVATVVVGLWLLFRFTVDSSAYPSRRTVIVLCVEPVLITAAAATNYLHHLVFATMSQVGHPTLLRTTAGPLLWVHTGYSYLLIASGAATVARAWVTATQLHRRQLSLILVSATVPILVNVITVAQFATGGGVDLTAVGFVATGALSCWALFDDGPLRQVPVARDGVRARQRRTRRRRAGRPPARSQPRRGNPRPEPAA